MDLGDWDFDNLCVEASNAHCGGKKLEARVVELESIVLDLRKRLVHIETTLNSPPFTTDHLATKTDLEKPHYSISIEMSKVVEEMTWRFLKISAVLVGMSFIAAKLM